MSGFTTGLAVTYRVYSIGSLYALAGPSFSYSETVDDGYDGVFGRIRYERYWGGIVGLEYAIDPEFTISGEASYYRFYTNVGPDVGYQFSGQLIFRWYPISW